MVPSSVLEKNLKKPDICSTAKLRSFYKLEKTFRVREAFNAQPYPQSRVPASAKERCQLLSGGSWWPWASSLLSQPRQIQSWCGRRRVLASWQRPLCARWASGTTQGKRQLLPASILEQEWRPGIKQVRLGGCTTLESGISFRFQQSHWKGEMCPYRDATQQRSLVSLQHARDVVPGPIPAVCLLLSSCEHSTVWHRSESYRSGGFPKHSVLFQGCWQNACMAGEGPMGGVGGPEVPTEKLTSVTFLLLLLKYMRKISGNEDTACLYSLHSVSTRRQD